MIGTRAMKQMILVQANSPSLQITENLLGAFILRSLFELENNTEKLLYFLAERAGCFTKNNVLARALTGVTNATYILLALSFDC